MAILVRFQTGSLKGRAFEVDATSALARAFLDDHVCRIVDDVAVVALRAGHQICAALSVQNVVAAVSGQLVVNGAPGRIQSGRTGENDILDVGAGGIREIRGYGIDSFAGVGYFFHLADLKAGECVVDLGLFVFPRFIIIDRCRSRGLLCAIRDRGRVRIRLSAGVLGVLDRRRFAHSFV